MGRTVPSFRIVLEQEKKEWKPFRNALNKSKRKMFDEMWDIPKLYISACSNSVQPVPLHTILVSILFHHYKELMECSKQVEEMMKGRRSVKIVHDLPGLREGDSLPEQYALFDFYAK